MLSFILEAAARSAVIGLAAWAGLSVFRTRNPHTQMTVWLGVLAVSIVMPALIAWPSLGVSLKAPVTIATFAEPLAPFTAAAKSVVAVPVVTGLDVAMLATAAYVCVAMVLLAKLMVGTIAAVGILRRATPLKGANADIRTTAEIDVPVTLGSSIILPKSHTDWSDAKRAAVLAHERAHVSYGHYYVLLLAAVYRAVFWVNPMAWVLHARIADLAESASDDAALNITGDRPMYADILVSIAALKSRRALGVPMARFGSVSRRVARVLDEAAISPRPRWRKRAAVLLALLPMAVIVSGVTLVTGGATAQVSPVPKFYVKPIIVNFTGFRIPEFVTTVFRDVLQVPYEIDPAVMKKTNFSIGIQSNDAMPADEFYQKVTDLLARGYGISVVYKDGVYHVVPSPDAKPN